MIAAEALVLFGFVCAAFTVLALLTGILNVLEMAFPAFSRWLDERVGEEPEWRSWP